MNALTSMMLLPLLGSLLVAVIPSDQVLRIKQAALGTTLLVAISGVMAWFKFDLASLFHLLGFCLDF